VTSQRFLASILKKCLSGTSKKTYYGTSNGRLILALAKEDLKNAYIGTSKKESPFQPHLPKKGPFWHQQRKATVL